MYGECKMKKVNLLDYLDQQIEKKITDYDVALDWDTKNHAIEIVIRLFAENKSHLEIDDIEGIASEEEIIEFEDGVLLYDPKKTNFDAEDYLATIPYEGKKGMKKSTIDALISYLNDVLADGQSDLLDFLEDTNEDAIFELKWDAEKFADYSKNQEEKSGGDYYPYPSY